MGALAEIMYRVKKRNSSVKRYKTEFGDLGGHMHHLAHSMTKLCQGREQDNAGWESIPYSIV